MAPVALLIALSAQILPVASSATMSATYGMYAFWCTGARSETELCKQNSLLNEFKAATTDAQKQDIRQKLTDLAKKGRAPSSVLDRVVPGLSRTVLSRQYAEMKMAFCATNPPNGKTLCATAASQYKNRSVSVTGAAMDWYCAKPSPSPAICQRVALMKRLREPTLTGWDRTKVAEELRKWPVPPFATTQAIYADFCTRSAPTDLKASSMCMSVKRTRFQQKMIDFYCKSPGNAEKSPWCKRNSIMQQLRSLTSAGVAKPAEGPMVNAKRTALLQSLAELNKGKQAALINLEIAKARKEFCATKLDSEAGAMCGVEATEAHGA